MQPPCSHVIRKLITVGRRVVKNKAWIINVTVVSRPELIIGPSFPIRLISIFVNYRTYVPADNILMQAICRSVSLRALIFCANHVRVADRARLRIRIHKRLKPFSCPGGRIRHVRRLVRKTFKTWCQVVNLLYKRNSERVDTAHR